MTWALLDSTGIGFGDGNAGHVLTYPSGAPANGDLLLLGVNSDTIVTTPSGWTAFPTGDVGNQGAYLFYRTAGPSDSGTVTITTAGDFSSAAVFARYSGARSSPADVSATTRVINTPGVSSPAVSPAALAETGELAVLFAACHNNTGGAATSPVPSAGYSVIVSSPMQSSGASGAQGFLLAHTTASGSETPTVSWSTASFNDRTAMFAAFLPQTSIIVPLGLPVETDTGLALAGQKTRVLGIATETDTALAVLAGSDFRNATSHPSVTATYTSSTTVSDG